MASSAALFAVLVVLSATFAEASRVELPSQARLIAEKNPAAKTSSIRSIISSFSSSISSLNGKTSPCDRLECPEYTVHHSESDFEIRKYNESVWVEAGSLMDVSFNGATSKGFRSLFDYIQGANDDHVKIPMTAPVLTGIVPSLGPFCSSAFAVRFFTPAQFSPHPPAPLPASGLKKIELSERCVAVRSFGGFATDFNVAEQALLLSSSLERTAWANITHRDDNSTGDAYTVAQYNSPFEFFGRVNEIWVAFEGKTHKGELDCTL